MVTSNPAAGARSRLQLAAQVVGAVFLLVGILGFIPGITSNFGAMGMALSLIHI